MCGGMCVWCVCVCVRGCVVCGGGGVCVCVEGCEGVCVCGGGVCGGVCVCVEGCEGVCEW